MKVFIFILILTPCLLLSKDVKTNPVHPVENKKMISDNWLGKDKAKHFIASFFLAGAGQWVSKYKFNSNRKNSAVVGLSFSFSLGLLKEIKDRQGIGHFSLKDLIADFLGGICGILLLRW